MIVCLCNAISEGDVRAALLAGATRPKEVYDCCGGRAQCGNCAPTVLRIIREETTKAPA
jgi:bacterioferritin-associated ferredoxin